MISVMAMERDQQRADDVIERRGRCARWQGWTSAIGVPLVVVAIGLALFTGGVLLPSPSGEPPAWRTGSGFAVTAAGFAIAGVGIYRMARAGMFSACHQAPLSSSTREQRRQAVRRVRRGGPAPQDAMPVTHASPSDGSTPTRSRRRARSPAPDTCHGRVRRNGHIHQARPRTEAAPPAEAREEQAPAQVPWSPTGHSSRRALAAGLARSRAAAQDQRRDAVGGVGLHRRVDVRADVQRDPDGGAPEPLGDHLGVDPRLQVGVARVWRRSCRITGRPWRSDRSRKVRENRSGWCGPPSGTARTRS